MKAVLGDVLQARNYPAITPKAGLRIAASPTAPRNDELIELRARAQCSIARNCPIYA